MNQTQVNGSERVGRPGAALVTGSGVRLGREIALALAKAGYDIALHYNSSDGPAKQTRQEILALGVDCQLFAQDLSRGEDLAGFVAQVKVAMPHLNVLVNSASAYASGTIAQSSVDLFDTQFNVNIRAPFFLSQGFAQVCDAGSIINICDNKIGFNQFEYAAYLLAKKALVELTRMAALEFAPRIRVNGVAPGVVLPAQSRSQEYIDWRIQGIPLRMQGSPDHITQAVLSLLHNPFITGQILTVDGGESITNVGQNAAQFDPAKV
jgi:NAD(P)-dependent dehydrogenase (short-subunit alcohol dehydrogenase family)